MTRPKLFDICFWCFFVLSTNNKKLFLKWRIETRPYVVIDFFYIFFLPKVLNLTLLGSSWGNMYTWFLILDINSVLPVANGTCTVLELCKIPGIMQIVVRKAFFCYLRFSKWFKFQNLFRFCFSLLQPIKTSCTRWKWKAFWSQFLTQIQCAKWCLHNIIKLETFSQLGCYIFNAETLKLKKISKYWSLKETGVSYKLAFVSKSFVENILRKIKKSSKVRQEQNTLISVFAYFWAPAPKFISVGQNGD